MEVTLQKNILALRTQLRFRPIFLSPVAVFLTLVLGAAAAYPLEFPQRRTYQLSCLFVPAAGTIELELNPHANDPRMVKASVHVAFSGVVGTLSGAREQKYTSIIMLDSPAGVTGVHHRQEVEIGRAGKRSRYGWEWRRDEEQGTFVAHRFWGGEQQQRTTLEGGADVVSDLLTLVVRIGVDAHGHHAQEEQRAYTLLDPEGNIQVRASFNSGANLHPAQTRVRLDFSRNPLTLGASRLEVWLNPAGEIMRGRIVGGSGLVPLKFAPAK